MAQNQLKYTGLTYDEIQSQISSLLYTDSRFERFRESSIAQTLIEIFTGTTDILNYYLNRRAEETFFDTAQLKSSVISLSRMFGYVMNRTEPAHAYLKLTIKGNIGDTKLQIPYYSKFSYGGNNYILLNTFTYNLTPDQYSTMIIQKDAFRLTLNAGTSQFNGDISGTKNIEIIQGDIREKVINGNNNTQAGAPFQIYKIDDKTFSNVYGDKDYFYNNVTKVWVGENKSDATEFSIDRRSLLSWNYINESSSNKTLNNASNVCLIRTATDGGVEILFGDANPDAINTIKNPMATAGFSRKGALTYKDNIYIQYLSTKGSAANTDSVIGDKVDFSGKIFNSSNIDITDKISFTFDSNIFGGADEESTDSIKYSAPKIYYSLDRLVSKQDYIAFLKTITYPLNVKNALAWGEQEERNKIGIFALVKMFNVVLFSVIGSLYGYDVSTDKRWAKSIREYNDVVLDLDYSPYKFQAQGYFNVYMVQNMVNQLDKYTLRDVYRVISSDNFGGSVDSNGNTFTPKTPEAIAKDIKDNLYTQYPTGTATATFTYTSDNTEYVSNIWETGSITIAFNDIPNNVGGNEYMKELATKINSALLNDVKDMRGNSIDNDNYTHNAFTPKNTDLFTWEASDGYNIDSKVSSASYRFNFGFSGDSPCYITVLGNENLWEILNLLGKETYPVSYAKDVSENNGKIMYMVDELTKRSQISVKNIYVSPVIHRFNIIGTVYVKSMYDKLQVQNEITNAIYEWADLNADFNTPIYLSNIIEIIENNSAVINANIRLQPEDKTIGKNGKKNLNYEPSASANVIYRKYVNSGISDKLADITNTHLNTYLQEYKNTKIYKDKSSTHESWNRDMYTDPLTTTGNLLECYTYTINNYITERTFYTDFASVLYNELLSIAKSEPTINGEPGPYSIYIQYNALNTNSAIQNATINSDFALVMEQIYRDLSYIIMNNMLDSQNNISGEKDVYGNIRGGYSLGTEIVQLIVDGKDKNNASLLMFEYKD